MYMCIYFLQRVRSGEWKGNVVCMSIHVLNMYMYIGSRYMGYFSTLHAGRSYHAPLIKISGLE